MVSAGDFKNGLTFEMDGNVMQVIEFQHVKPGKGAAFVRAKLKNVISGATLEQTFNPTAKFAAAVVERKDMQYSYSDGDLYYFMDNETFDQVPLNADKLPDSFKFVKEGMECRLVSFKGNVFSVEPPMFVAGGHAHRAGRQGQHRHQRHQARHRRDRRGDQGADVHQRGRRHQNRYENKRVSGTRVRVERWGAQLCKFAYGRTCTGELA